MDALSPGAAVPPVPGVALGTGPAALWFFKSDCPACFASAPAVARLAEAHAGRVTLIGQDRPEDLEAFVLRYGLAGIPRVIDPPPYEISESYGLEVTPTLHVVGTDRRLALTVEAWDRDAYNAASAMLGDLAGVAGPPVSQPGDGLPPFRPG